MKELKKYDKEIKKILKKYDSILVKCKNIPILSDKNIIMVDSIDGMVNTQIETRKPILYFQEEDSVSFMLLDGNETYVYIIKANEAKENIVERTLNVLEIVEIKPIEGVKQIEEAKSSKNIYLVPVTKRQKKWWFFSKNKKAKRAKESKHERRRMIG